jgi:hypothetical protein
MTNRPLRSIQMSLNRFIDSTNSFWMTNARFVGSLRYLQFNDPLHKLLLKLENLYREHRFTTSQQEEAHRIKVAISALFRSKRKARLFRP